MAAYLKVIGSGKDPCPEPYTKPYADFSPKRPPTRIRQGDHLVLYAAGGRKCVFALAEVTSDVKPSDYGDWPHRLEIRYLVNLSPADGILAQEISTTRDLTMSVRQQTCVKLQPEEYERAKALLEESERAAAKK
ncbi:MAG TPA: hypothetical protein VNI02_08135 [Blastocatellia bacterium]|jgi:hypothetical protein|nr:hypothetical protein [Blastocatellia bacterium]